MSMCAQQGKSSWIQLGGHDSCQQRFSMKNTFATQCWFKLFGQNEESIKFQTLFSQIAAKNFTKIIMVHCFSEILIQNFTPKMGRFGFLIDQKLPETTKWKLPKIYIRENIFDS